MSHSNGEERFTEVMAGLRRQRELIGRLERLAQRQGRIVRDDQFGSAREIAAEYSAVLRELRRCTETLQPSRGPTGQTHMLGDGRRGEMDRLAAENHLRMRRLMDAGQRELRMVGIKKNAIGAALQATHESQTALGAYGTRASRSPRLDLTNGAQD